MEISPQTYSELVAAARAAAARHCPYSRFNVGAAILTGADEIFAGCNVENASFGLTISPSGMRSSRQSRRAVDRFRFAVVVFTPTTTPTAPCGACRQVINEFGPDARVISLCDGPVAVESSLGILLPQAFGPGNLESDA